MVKKDINNNINENWKYDQALYLKMYEPIFLWRQICKRQ